MAAAAEELQRGMAGEPGGRQHFSLSAPHLTMLVVCVVAVYFVVGFYGKSLDSYRMNQRAAEVRGEIGRLEAENREIRQHIAYLQSDAYIETEAREKLNLAQPGDRSVVVLRDPRSPVGPPGPPPPRTSAGRLGSLAGLGHLEEWLDLFFDPR